AVRERRLEGFERVTLAREAQHDLVLVERGRPFAHLIDDPDVRAISVRPDVAVDLLVVVAGRALDVTVVGRHRHGPGLTVRADTAPLRSLRVLDRDLETVEADVPLRVVAGGDLRVGRLERHAVLLEAANSRPASASR